MFGAVGERGGVEEVSVFDGFSPVVGALVVDCSNRCAKVVRGGVPSFGGEGDGETVVDVVSVVFDAGDVATVEQRGTVEERWEAVVGLVVDGGSRRSYAVWLENNASTFAEPTPEEIAAGLTSAVFIGFVTWDGECYDSRRAEELCTNLRASLPSSDSDNGPVISRKAVRLIKHAQPPYSQHTQPVAPHNSLASILKPDPTRQCSADIGNVAKRANEALASSYATQESAHGSSPPLEAALCSRASCSKAKSACCKASLT